MTTEKAQRIIDRLEGTLIADLKTIKLIAEKRNNNEEMYECLPGGLNFALFLFGLIASETIGFYITKDTNAGRTERNIKGFISSDYFKGTAYKKEKYLNILISLRTNIAHVFGMTDLKLESISAELELCVGGTNKSELLSNGKNVKMNGIKFADYVIDGFESIKSEVFKKNEKSIVASIIRSKV